MPVMGPFDHHADAHLDERCAIVTLQHPAVGRERHVRNPIRMSATRQRTAMAAPCMGADTHVVLHSWLGLENEEIDALVHAGVCQ